MSAMRAGAGVLGAAAVVAAVGQASGQVVGNPIGGAVTPDRVTGECIQPEVRQMIETRAAAYRRAHPDLGRQGTDTPPPLYQFYPHAGTLYTDLNTGNFVDLDPNPNEVLNYLCATYGNDGHLGCDTGSPSWEEMAIGLPAFAALDGTVIDMVDGQPDHNTSCIGTGNYVFVDDGNGRETLYYHFKTGSILVHIGDVVRAGQQLGLTGSSGCSYSPHLHFETHQNGNVIEPFAGPCNAVASGWAHQVDPPADARMMEFGVTSQNIGNAPAWPARPPTSPQMLFSDGDVFYWAEMLNLPANSTWTERYIYPSGQLDFELGPFPFNNPTVYAWSLYWFDRNISEMHSIAGTWHIQFLVNGQMLINAPVEVAATATQGFNRAPETVTASFDPPAPNPADVIFCRLGWVPGLKDRDWDIVSYHYVWKVNGTVVRDAVSVGGADAIPRNTATAGQILECDITPNDGHVDGATTVARVAVGCYANCDASSNAPVLNVSDFTCFLQKFAQGSAYANCDGSTSTPVLNVSDFTCFLQKFAQGCP